MLGRKYADSLNEIKSGLKATGFWGSGRLILKYQLIIDVEGAHKRILSIRKTFFVWLVHQIGRTTMRQIVVSLMIVATILAAGIPLMAHHSFAAEFDSNKQMKVTGVVTKIDWTNPHVWFYIDVKDESGKVTNWGWEMGPPHLLQGTGWTRTTMKLGDVVTVQGSLAKNGSNRGNARNVTTPDGKKMGAASSEGQAQP